MKTKESHWLAVALVLGMALGLLVLILSRGQARAGDPGSGRSPQSVFAQPAAAGAPSMFAAPLSDGGVLDLSGSDVATTSCYQEGKSQTLCFTVYNGSTDGEWIDIVRLNFPDASGAWTVNASVYEDPTDSIGYVVNFTHTISGKQIEYQSGDTDGFGEISNGASWEVCVDVYVPSGYDEDRYVWWDLVGDATPTPDTESGQAKMEKCTPLTLKPSQVVITGCNGLAQSLEFELTNYSAGTVDLGYIYNAPEADFTGDGPSIIQQGETVTFTAEFKPNLCLEAGQAVTGTLKVMGGGYDDESFITQSIAETHGWRRRADSDIPTMDNVVIWAHREDGVPGDEGLWSIGGFGSDGAVQRYDPGSDTWRKDFESEAVITPLIEYPMDGCYGLNGDGDEIVVLFPDTIVTGSLHVFNIEHQFWYTLTTPTGEPGEPDYPQEGRWGHDVVSMLQHTGENVCYLSGGSTQTGGGRTRDLWEYHPDTNTVIDHSPFPASVWFGFHASWYVPWVGDGDGGAICVAGGVDYNHIIHSATQCFSRTSGTFGGLNADLGELPELWWGMADGWQITDQGYELWIANGVASDGTLLPVSAYFREGMPPAGGFQYGPPIPHGLYRLEGDAWNDQFYTLNGSRGGFWYSEFSLHLSFCPTCNEVFLPLTLRDH
jgi:hypothetical protein